MQTKRFPIAAASHWKHLTVETQVDLYYNVVTEKVSFRLLNSGSNGTKKKDDDGSGQVMKLVYAQNRKSI